MRKEANCDTRFRHKLNMLEPGIAMLKAVGVLLLAGGALLALDWKGAAHATFGAAGLVFLVLLILIAIEAHQDRVLNEMAKRERE